MSFHYCFKRNIESLKTKTNVFDTVKVWDDGDAEDSLSWKMDYGDLLYIFGDDYLEHIKSTCSRVLSTDSFKDEEFDDAHDAFVQALMARSRVSTFYKDTLTTIVEPLRVWQLSDFRFFAKDSNGHYMFMRDMLAVKTWLEEQIDPDDFLRYLNDFRIRDIREHIERAG